MEKKIFIVQAVLLMMFVTDTLGAAPSFDCKIEKLTLIEKTICESSWLSSLDAYYAELHTYLLAEVVDKSAFIADQRAWLKERDKCETRSCLSDIYMNRFETRFSKYQQLLAGRWIAPNSFVKKLENEVIAYNASLPGEDGSFGVARTGIVAAVLTAEFSSGDVSMSSKIPIPAEENPIGIQHNLVNKGEAANSPDLEMVPDVGRRIPKIELMGIRRISADRYAFKYNIMILDEETEKKYGVSVLTGKNIKIESIEHNAGEKVEEHARRQERLIKEFKPASKYADLNKLYLIMHDLYISGYRAPVQEQMQKVFLFTIPQAKEVAQSSVCAGADKKVVFIVPVKDSEGIELNCRHVAGIYLGSEYGDTIGSSFGWGMLAGLSGNDTLGISGNDAVFWGGKGDDTYRISHGNALVLLGKNWGHDVFNGSSVGWLILSRDIDINDLKWVSGEKLVYGDTKSSITFQGQPGAYKSIGIVRSGIRFD